MAEREQMTAQDVQGEPFPDADEPKGHTAGLSLLLIIGGIFLTMIVVMVVAFMYFNSGEGPTSLARPMLAAVSVLIG